MGQIFDICEVVKSYRSRQLVMANRDLTKAPASSGKVHLNRGGLSHSKISIMMSGKDSYSDGDESVLDDDQSFVTEDERRHSTGQSDTFFGTFLDSVAQGLGYDVASGYGDSAHEESTVCTTRSADDSTVHRSNGSFSTAGDSSSEGGSLARRRKRWEKAVQSLAQVDEESSLVGPDEFSADIILDSTSVELDEFSVDVVNYRALHSSPETSQDSNESSCSLNRHKQEEGENSTSTAVVDLERIRSTRGRSGKTSPYTSPERKTNNGKNQNIKASAAGSPKTDIHKRTNENAKPFKVDLKSKDVKSNSRTASKVKVPAAGFRERFLYKRRNEDPPQSLSPAKNEKSNSETGKVKADAAATPKSIEGKVEASTAAVPRSPAPAKHAKANSKTEKVKAPAAETPLSSTTASSRANIEECASLEGTMGPPSFSQHAEASKKTTAHTVQCIPVVEEQPNLGRNNSGSSPKGLQDFPFLPSPEPKDFPESFMDLITCRSPNGHNPCNAPQTEDEAMEISYIPIVPGDSSIGELTATTYEMKVNIARYMRNLDLAEQEVVGKLALTRGEKPSSMHKGVPGSHDSACHDTVRNENYFEEYVHEPSPTTEAADIAQAKLTAKTMVGGGIRGLNLVGSRQLPVVNDETPARFSRPKPSTKCEI
jgi:hypothetical protein